MQKIETELPGVLIFSPKVFADERGFFLESYSERTLAEFGLHPIFVQDNHSKSVRGTLRGLHYQLRHPQTKLCRVVRGRVLDVVLDVRRGSPAFGRSITVELSEENKLQIFVPQGLAHGFIVLSEEAEFLYKCDDFYQPGDEFGVRWNDESLAIDWRLTENGLSCPVLSAKDQLLPRLAEIDSHLLPKYQPD